MGGFYLLLIIQLFSSAFYLTLYTSALALHSSINIFIQKSIEDLQNIFIEMDAKYAKEANKLQLNTTLTDAINFHAELIR